MSMADETERWVDAAILLADDPSAKVRCPRCRSADLEVTDVDAGGNVFERLMRCPNCGVFNAMRMNRSAIRSDASVVGSA
jgi:hypothetical protein